MTVEHGNFFDESGIPPEIMAQIQDEVSKDIEQLGDDESEGAEFLREVLTDARTSTYLFLTDINHKYDPKLLLYPSSGFDNTAKLAFGEERVVHTSLEKYQGKDNDIKYFDHLKSRMRVVADNADLPFAYESCDAIYFHDSPPETRGSDLSSFLKVLKTDGLILVAQNHILNEDDTLIDECRENSSLEELEVPEELQFRGEDQVEFAVFQKKSGTEQTT